MTQTATGPAALPLIGVCRGEQGADWGWALHCTYCPLCSISPWLATRKTSIHHHTFTADCTLPYTQVQMWQIQWVSAPSSTPRCPFICFECGPVWEESDTKRISAFFGLPVPCAKTSIPIPPPSPVQPPIPWLLPQSYTKKHKLYGLRALNHKEQQREDRFWTRATMLQPMISSSGHIVVKGLWALLFLYKR